LGYTIWAPAKRRIGWVKEAFGGTQDASELARGRRRFLKQLEQLVAIDWQLPRQDFHRSIEAAIDQHFPELSPGARLVLLTRFDHLRCEPMAVAIGRAISDRLARRALIPWA
jgi:hypothetical protein